MSIIHTPITHFIHTETCTSFILRLFLHPCQANVTATKPCDLLNNRSIRQWKVWLENGKNRSLLPAVFSIVNNHKIEIPNEIYHYLKNFYLLLLVRYQTFKSAGEEVLDILRLNGLPARIFKGTDLASRLYPEPELRVFKDIDILINPADSSVAHDILVQQGWQFTGRIHIHSAYKKNGVSIELHDNLFGWGESILYNYDSSHLLRYLNHDYSAEEEYILLIQKSFSDAFFDKIKLVDLYLFNQLTELDFSKVTEAAKKHNAAYPLKAVTAITDKFVSKFDTENRPEYLWELSSLWNSLRYLTLLLHSPPLFKKLWKILFPGHRKFAALYPDRKISTRKHIYSMFCIFTGIKLNQKRPVSSITEINYE